MVVGSAREGDTGNEDPPLSGTILLGWHGVPGVDDASPNRIEQRSRRQRIARRRALDVQESCRPGPSFNHDNRGN